MKKEKETRRIFLKNHRKKKKNDLLQKDVWQRKVEN